MSKVYEFFLFLSMDPLYPPGLDENCAVDDLYAASWICITCMKTRYCIGKKL